MSGFVQNEVIEAEDFLPGPLPDTMPAQRQTLCGDPARTRQGGTAGASRFNPNVHGARGVLALMVFVFHVAASGAPGFAWQAGGLGHAALVSLQFGVEIFFAISGFIIAGALARAAGPVDFLRGRAVRILPVLWLTLAVLVPLGLLTHQGVFATLKLRDLAWVLSANLVPLAGLLPLPLIHLAAWSLSYEFLFYVVATAMWWIPARHQAARLAVAALAAVVVIWHPRAIFFAVGVLVARTDVAAQPWLRRATRLPGLMLAGFFACWYMVEFGGASPAGTLLDWAHDGRIGLAAVAVSLAILAFAGLVAGEGWLGRLLRTGPLQRLGTVSYSFYLWHIIVIGIAKRGLAMSGIGAHVGPWSQLVLAAACLPVSLCVAQASLRLVEQGLSPRLKQVIAGSAALTSRTSGIASV